MLIDSHAHLETYDAGAEREQVVQNAYDAGVRTILTIGTNLHDSRINLEIADQYSQIFATVGIHPHDINDTDIQTFESELKTMASHEKVVAIGEIGLDFYRNTVSPELQYEFFRRQLKLAKTLNLPVIIHDREAHQEVLQLIEEVDVSSVGGVFHCFSGDLNMAARVRELGFLVSIAGPITYKKPGFLPEIAAKVPLESLLVETDSPFLTPVPFRGKRNEPAYVKYTAEKVAEIRGISVETLAEHTSQNFAGIFRKMG